MPTVLCQLRDWICAKYGVSVVHLLFEEVEIDPPRSFPRLSVFLETDSDYDSWKKDAFSIRPEIQRRV